MNQPDPTCSNETQLFVTFVKLFVFIMSLLGVTLHLQSKRRSPPTSKRPIEDDSPLDDVVKRVYYQDSEESSDSGERILGGLRYSQIEISGIAPLDETTPRASGSDSPSLNDVEMDGVALEQTESTLSVYYDAESEPERTDSILEDALGENVFWSICHELQNGRLRVCYKCHICSSMMNAEKLLLEHFVLEHEMDLIVV